MEQSSFADVKVHQSSGLRESIDPAFYETQALCIFPLNRCYI